ncbi:MAG: outer membrane beta-barrel protein [Bacteroidales bacterium]|nr:outer membrane beta-barrel protein [Bacteroidales bacterium]
MKTRTILSAFLIFFISAQTFAQSTTSDGSKSKPKFWMGPKFGLDLSPITLKPGEITDQLKTNFQAGILAQYGRILYVQPEVYYSKYKIGDISASYIKVPAMLGCRFLNLGLVSFHVMGGPAFSLQLNNKDTFDNDVFSWQVGAGFDVFGLVTADVRYTLKDGVSISDQVSQFDAETDMLNITLGLKFR